MNRRDFLLFRTEQQRQLVELSCERLYMQYLDAQAAADRQARPQTVEPWDGEPPSELAMPGTRELFEELDRRLKDVSVVRIADAEWLAVEDFRGEVDRVLSAFRRRGGRVELVSATASK